jgi:hypothetical protein
MSTDYRSVGARPVGEVLLLERPRGQCRRAVLSETDGGYVLWTCSKRGVWAGTWHAFAHDAAASFRACGGIMVEDHAKNIIPLAESAA